MILVLIEVDGIEVDGAGVSPLSLEALTFARTLAGDPAGGGHAGPAVHAVVVGDLPGPVLADLAGHGVGVVHVSDDARLSEYSAGGWAAAVLDVVRAHQPSSVLAAGSARGNEVLAHAAARLGLPMAANCTGVEGDPAASPLVLRRQVIGGAALEELDVTSSPVILTLAGHVIEARPASAASTPQVEAFTPELTDADVVGRVRRVEAVAAGGDSLTKARVVVGAGRGVGGAERFDGVLELAQLLGGAIGVSRVVTSLGWRPHHEQVGQTGTRIAPDVYIACGISGAIQHWAGCSSARTILAINTDAEAPMVTKAQFAVIGDLHEIVPAINAELTMRRSR
jgi:electron transfer flavoprotein alpha subunit